MLCLIIQEISARSPWISRFSKLTFWQIIAKLVSTPKQKLYWHYMITLTLLVFLIHSSDSSKIESPQSAPSCSPPHLFLAESFARYHGRGLPKQAPVVRARDARAGVRQRNTLIYCICVTIALCGQHLFARSGWCCNQLYRKYLPYLWNKLSYLSALA